MSTRKPSISQSLFPKRDLPTDIASCHALIYELLSVIQSLEERLSSIEEAQGTSSQNSSKSPSSDSVAQRAKRPKKTKTGLKRGAQVGHKKHQRMLVDESEIAKDRLHHHYPDHVCHCGGTRVIQQQSFHRHQIFDLPRVQYLVDEHRLYAGVCTCCHKQARGTLPPSVPKGQMGAGLISWITLMNGAYNQSIRSIQRLMEAQWQLSFSLGAISQATRPVTEWLLPLYRQVHQAVLNSPVVHADETTHYHCSSRYWLWTLCSPKAVFFMMHFSRGKGAANLLLKGYKGILVSDQHGGYNDYPMVLRQLCWAHLIRKFRKIASRTGKSGTLGQQLLRMSQLMIHFHHRWLDKHYSDDTYRRRMEKIKTAFHTLLKQGAAFTCPVTKKPNKTANQCCRLLKDEPMLWTFLNDPKRIPLTNNSAEQAIRPYVIWRKNSFFTQSLRGLQFRPVILTIVETCKRLKMNAYQLLREVCHQGIQGLNITVRLPFQEKYALA